MKKRIHFFIILCLLLLQQLSAETVTSFSYSGLKKTKESYLNSVLERFYGREINTDTLHEIETALHAEGLFEDISVECPDEQSGSVEITLREKITFIPLPFLTVSSGKWMGGGIVMNMNAFGNKTMVMGGGFLSAQSKSFIAGLSKPPAAVKDTGYSLFAGAADSTQTVKDIYDEEISKTDFSSLSLSSSVQKKITHFTTLNASLSLACRFFDSTDSLQLKAGTGFSHGKNDWNGWYLNSRMFTAAIEGGRDFSSENFFWSTAAKITVQQPLTNRLRLCSDIAFSYEKNTLLIQHSSQSAAAVSILPSEFLTPSIAGGNAGLEFALKKFNWGLLSVYSSWQAVFAETQDDSMKFCHGAAGGVRVYLSKIAFPAFAFGMSTNFTTGDSFWSASLGISY